MVDVDRSPLPPFVKDIRGLRFGKLVVVQFSHIHPKTRYAIWLLRCDCGGVATANCSDLKKGHKATCGCTHSRLQHGCAKKDKWTRTYRIWTGLSVRCHNRNSRKWKWYGARGIVVCDRWKKFENFIEDMGEPPQGMELDRIDNDGNYEPTNCRWTTRREQMRNTRHNRYLSMGGETMCVASWAERTGLSQQRIYTRLKADWTIERARTTAKLY